MSDDMVVETFEPNEVGVQNDGEPVAAPVAEAPAQGEVAATEPETTTTQEAEQDDDEHPRKKTGSQRWKERALFYKEELDRLRGNAQSAAPSVPVAVGKPTPDQFSTDAEYVEALVEFKAEEKVRAMREQEARESMVKSWQEKAQVTRAKYADFDDALESAPAPTPHVADAMMQSPVGTEIAYYLATHPDDYQRINSMPPVKAVRELTLLEMKLASPAAKPEPKKASQAPKPPAPVTAVAAPQTTKDDKGFEVY